MNPRAPHIRLFIFNIYLLLNSIHVWIIIDGKEAFGWPFQTITLYMLLPLTFNLKTVRPLTQIKEQHTTFLLSSWDVGVGGTMTCCVAVPKNQNNNAVN